MRQHLVTTVSARQAELPWRPREDRTEILPTTSMRVEGVGALPEPAVGISVTPGTPSVATGQPGRVAAPGSCIRDDGPDRTRPSPGPATVGFGRGVLAGQRRGPRQRRRVT